MSDIYVSVWCSACAAVTAHYLLRDGLHECSDCGETRTFHLSDGLYGLGENGATPMTTIPAEDGAA